jgi:hypothetical protein
LCPSANTQQHSFVSNPNKHDLIEKNTADNEIHLNGGETPRKRIKKSSSNTNNTTSLNLNWLLQLNDFNNTNISSPKITEMNWLFLNDLLSFELTDQHVKTFIQLLFNIQILAASVQVTNTTTNVKLDLLSFSMQLLSSCLISSNKSKLSNEIKRLLIDQDDQMRSIRIEWLKSLIL